MDFGKIITKIRCGSHLYGLNTEKSDEDFVGVFIPKPEYFLGLKKVEYVDNSTKKSSSQYRNTVDDVDEKFYALPKFLHLFLQNNPNIVELLFANRENILETSDIWEELISNTDKIISTKIYHTFKGFAYSQKNKLTIKSNRFTSLRIAIENIEAKYTKEELFDPARTINYLESDQLNKWLTYYKGQKQNCESFHKGMSIKMIYEKIVNEYEKYGWRVKTNTFEKLGYDIKFGYNLIRVLAEGTELLRTGKLIYPMSGSSKIDIIRIRSGEVEIKELLSMYEKYENQCNKAYEISKLPKKPDFNWADKWLIKTLKKYIVNN